MHNPKILIISDEPETARIWGFSLNQIGLEVFLVGITEQPLQVFAAELPDLIIIEDFNKENEELELCRQLREVSVVPILYLTSKTAEDDLLDIYRVGADESIPLPVGSRLFQEKVKAWLRRTQTIPAAALDVLDAGDFHLDLNRKRLTCGSGEVFNLTALEARLLLVLMSHAGVFIESQQLVERVWGYFGQGDTMLLKNLVYRLRKKIEPDPRRPRYLLHAANSGYCFQAGGESL